MRNIFLFSARKTLVNNKTWLWIPSLHALNGKNLVWNKGFKTEKEAIAYLEIHIERIKSDHF